jgi:hypothetical protein
VTSYQQLRADGLRADRHNRLHPDDELWVPYVIRQLADKPGPVIAATDYLKAVPDLIARWITRPYVVLGTDGFGRSDTREALRTYFEVSPEHIAYAAMVGLSRTGEASGDELVKARSALGIDPGQADPAAIEPTHEPATAPMARPSASGADASPKAAAAPTEQAAAEPQPNDTVKRAREAASGPPPEPVEPASQGAAVADKEFAKKE